MESSFQNILNCFTGADGGVSFIKFRLFIEDMEKQFEEGSDEAGKVLTIMDRFSRMIDIANGNVDLKTPSNKRFNENYYLE